MYANLHKVLVSKLNGMVAFGHLLFERSALLSLNRVSSSSPSPSPPPPTSSSSVIECLLLPCKCAKCSRVDDDNDDDDNDDIESASCEMVPGEESVGYVNYCHSYSPRYNGCVLNSISCCRGYISWA